MTYLRVAIIIWCKVLMGWYQQLFLIIQPCFTEMRLGLQYSVLNNTYLQLLLFRALFPQTLWSPNCWFEVLSFSFYVSLAVKTTFCYEGIIMETFRTCCVEMLHIYVFPTLEIQEFIARMIIHKSYCFTSTDYNVFLFVCICHQTQWFNQIFIVSSQNLVYLNVD